VPQNQSRHSGEEEKPSHAPARNQALVIKTIA